MNDDEKDDRAFSEAVEATNSPTAKIIHALTVERDQLAAWKAEALLVESRWDCQKVGKLLGIQLGQDIRPNIEPRIRALLDARHEVETKLNDALVENAHLKDRLAAGDCKDS